MGWITRALATDGLTQWREVFASLERHMAGQREILAGLIVVLLVVVLVIIDVKAARWLLSRGRSGRRSR